MEFLRSLLRRRFARAQVATSRDVGCFPRLSFSPIPGHGETRVSMCKRLTFFAHSDSLGEVTSNGPVLFCRCTVEHPLLESNRGSRV